MEYPKSYNSTQYCNKEVRRFSTSTRVSRSGGAEALIQQVTKILDTDVPTYSLWITRASNPWPRVKGSTFKLGSGYNWTSPYSGK